MYADLFPYLNVIDLCAFMLDYEEPALLFTSSVKLNLNDAIMLYLLQIVACYSHFGTEAILGLAYNIEVF